MLTVNGDMNVYMWLINSLPTLYVWPIFAVAIVTFNYHDYLGNRTHQNLMTTDPQKIWPDGIVYVKFDSDFGK